jgi:response regulator RpfG family c-di-GMP phosphodiesterase
MMKNVVECYENKMYRDDMLEEIKGRMSDRGYASPWRYVDRLFREMLSLGVKPMWIDHSIKTSEFAVHIARNPQKYLRPEHHGKFHQLTKQQLADIRLGAKLHDIGKIIGFVGANGDYKSLNGDVRMTPEELDYLRLHPLVSWSYVTHLDPEGKIGLKRDGVMECILYHQENYNGTGYPMKLAGEDIPLGARILRVVDVIDAAGDPSRKWSKDMTPEQIMAHLKENEGKLFDPMIAEIFYEPLRGEQHIRKYLKSHPAKKFFPRETLSAPAAIASI